MSNHRRINKFFQNHNVIQRVERRHWNKAVELIEGKRSDRGPMCLQSRQEALYGKQKKIITIPIMLSEIRQAMLRHDWNNVCCLLECLVKSPAIYRLHHAVINKIISVLLLSSPASNPSILEDFCRMVLGINDEEIGIFLRTMRHLPKEIPRGRVWHCHGAGLKVRGESGLTEADSYIKASRVIRSKDADAPAVVEDESL